MIQSDEPCVRHDTLPAPSPLDLTRTAMFLDLDGVLAPIAARPGDVGPDPSRRAVLNQLVTATGGRVAVVSGRALADIDRILEGVVTAVGAVHGLVRRRADGTILSPPPPRGMEEAVGAVSLFAESRSGLLVERKGVAVALHFRGAPELGAACHDLADRLAARLDLQIQRGDHVVELRGRGPDKGAALRAFMDEAPFHGYAPLFLGDDLTDEAGFRAAQDFGGLAIIVGTRRPTAATHALPDVAAALAWLGASTGSENRSEPASTAPMPNDNTGLGNDREGHSL
jgi:trehalose 6-phosphate phosphatase